MSAIPYVLAIETSGDWCSVAVGAEGEVLKEASLHMPYGQAAHILKLVEEVSVVFDKDWHQVSKIVVNRGPGSFTGIRVGLSVAEGFAYAGKIPLVGVTGFQVYRALFDKEQDLCVVLDSRRDGHFVACFEKNQWAVKEHVIMRWEEVQKQKRSTILTNVHALKDDDVLYKPLTAEMLLKAYRVLAGHVCEFSDEPFYLKSPDIHESCTTKRTAY